MAAAAPTAVCLIIKRTNNSISKDDTEMKDATRPSSTVKYPSPNTTPQKPAQMTAAASAVPLSSSKRLAFGGGSVHDGDGDNAMAWSSTDEMCGLCGNDVVFAFRADPCGTLVCDSCATACPTSHRVCGVTNCSFLLKFHMLRMDAEYTKLKLRFMALRQKPVDRFAQRLQAYFASAAVGPTQAQVSKVHSALSTKNDLLRETPPKSATLLSCDASLPEPVREYFGRKTPSD